MLRVTPLPSHPLPSLSLRVLWIQVPCLPGSPSPDPRWGGEAGRLYPVLLFQSARQGLGSPDLQGFHRRLFLRPGSLISKSPRQNSHDDHVAGRGYVCRRSFRMAGHGHCCGSKLDQKDVWVGCVGSEVSGGLTGGK